VDEFEFRRAHASDVAHVAAHLCAGEQITFRDLYGDADPAERVGDTVRRSVECWAAVLNGEPLALFGVVRMSLLGGDGALWFLATDEAFRHPGALIRGGRKYVSELLTRFDSLGGRVDARHQSTVKWVRLLGFDVRPAEAESGVLFHRFEKKADHVL